MHKIGLLLILWLAGLSVFSQTTSKEMLLSISGRVIDSKTKIQIPFASIGIKRTGMGTVSDTLGVFHLRVHQGDTLLINALGYRSRLWPVPYVLETDNFPFFTIEMEDKAYLLKEVNVYAFGTYEQFKKSFLNLKLKEKNPINKSIYQALKPYMRKVGEKNPVPLYLRPKSEKIHILDAVFRPTDFLYSVLSRKERAKRKFSRYIRNAPKRKIVAKRYNAQVVSSITGLKGQELIRFMEFCGGKMKEVTHTTTEYEVTQEIMRVYQLYQSKEK